MNAVVTTAMNSSKVVRMIRASVTLLDQMVRGVGIKLAAQAADAVANESFRSLGGGCLDYVF
jgi:hypothetical protein